MQESHPPRPDRADMVTKSRDHHDSKYRAGVAAMFVSRSVPLVGAAGAVGETGA